MLLSACEYLLKMIACSGVMAIYYWLFLRNKPFHNYNRFYILFAVAVSVVLPLVNIPVFWTNSSGNSPIYVDTLQTVTIYPIRNAVQGWGDNYAFLVIGGYILIALIRLRSDWLSINKIGKLRRKHDCMRIGNINLYKVGEASTPFSFMNSIFWNPELALESKKGQQIFRHESAHALQGHSYDIIFMRAVMVAAWINPFFHFFHKELVMTHEFLADDAAANESDKNGYAECLVSEAIQQKNFSPLTTHFYYSPLKRRIHMLLHKFNRDRFSLIRNLLVIPVTVLMFFALAVHGQTPGTAEAKPSPNPRSNASANVRANANVQANARSSSNVTVIAHRSSTSRVSDRNSNGEEAKFPGGEEAWRKYLFTAVHYPIEAQDKEIQGTVVVQFKVAADGTTTEVTALSGPKEGGLKEEAVRLVKGSGKWMPAVKNGKPVASTKKQPIIFRLESQ